MLQNQLTFFLITEGVCKQISKNKEKCGKTKWEEQKKKKHKKKY